MTQIIVPADNSSNSFVSDNTRTTDVLGRPLTHVGQVRHRAKVKDVNVGNFDGINSFVQLSEEIEVEVVEMNFIYDGKIGHNIESFVGGMHGSVWTFFCLLNDKVTNNINNGNGASWFNGSNAEVGKVYKLKSIYNPATQIQTTYLDGVLALTCDFTNNDVDYRLNAIGKGVYDRFWHGKIWDVKLYGADHSTPIHHYLFNEGQGDTVYDSIGNNHGTWMYHTDPNQWDKQDAINYSLIENRLKIDSNVTIDFNPYLALAETVPRDYKPIDSVDDNATIYINKTSRLPSINDILIYDNQQKSADDLYRINEFI